MCEVNLESGSVSPQAEGGVSMAEVDSADLVRRLCPEASPLATPAKRERVAKGGGCEGEDFGGVRKRCPPPGTSPPSLVPLTRVRSEAKGLPPQFRTSNSATLRRWMAAGRPESLRAERKARRRRSSLESPDNSVEAKPGRDVEMLCSVRCRRHVCPQCRRLMGLRTRARLHERVRALQCEHKLAGDVLMLTLTCDPANYKTAEDAWLGVGAERGLGELFRWLRVQHQVEHGVWVLEWHESGWPHWHVLIWVPRAKLYIPHAGLTSAWGRGHVWISPRRGRPIAWAVNYATKYLTKVVKSPPPAWVMRRSYVRMVGTTRGMGRVVADDALDSAERAEDVGLAAGEAPAAAAVRSNEVAVRECGGGCVLIRESVDGFGVLRRKYLGRVPLPFRVVRRMMCRARELGLRADRAVLRVAVDASAWLRLRNALPLVE